MPAQALIQVCADGESSALLPEPDKSALAQREVQSAVIQGSPSIHSYDWQVLVSDPRELEKIRERELDITRERVQKILDAGESRA